MRRIRCRVMVQEMREVVLCELKSEVSTDCPFCEDSDTLNQEDSVYDDEWNAWEDQAGEYLDP